PPYKTATCHSRKLPRRRISAACASVGALESGFTVEPCATINNAAFGLLSTPEFYHREHRGQREREEINSIAVSVSISVYSCRFVVELLSAPGRRRFFRSTDRCAVGPTTASASIDHR